MLIECSVFAQSKKKDEAILPMKNANIREHYLSMARSFVSTEMPTHAIITSTTQAPLSSSRRVKVPASYHLLWSTAVAVRSVGSRDQQRSIDAL